jgi:ABC-2 type transport system permease protein
LTLFVFALVGLGLFFSAILPDKLFATQVLMVIASPSFLISGYTWPQFSMVGWLRFLSDSQPVTHFALALRQVFIQGGSLESVRPHILWLWTMAFLCYGLAYLAIARLLRKTALSAPDHSLVLEKTGV